MNRQTVLGKLYGGLNLLDQETEKNSHGTSSMRIDTLNFSHNRVSSHKDVSANK